MQTQATDLARDPQIVAMGPKLEEIGAAATIRITNAQQYIDAGEWLKSIKGLLAKIEEARTRITKPLVQAQREVNNQAKLQSQPLLDAEALIKRGMGAYTTEQERLRREEQRKADETARKHQLQLQERADKAAASGKLERAEELHQQATSVVAPVIQREVPKVVGIVMREAWKFEVENAALIPREYLMVDETKIRKVVQALKGDTKIPGVRVYSDTQVAAGVG